MVFSCYVIYNGNELLSHSRKFGSFFTNCNFQRFQKENLLQWNNSTLFQCPHLTWGIKKLGEMGMVNGNISELPTQTTYKKADCFQYNQTWKDLSSLLLITFNFHVTFFQDTKCTHICYCQKKGSTVISLPTSHGLKLTKYHVLALYMDLKSKCRIKVDKLYLCICRIM